MKIRERLPRNLPEDEIVALSQCTTESNVFLRENNVPICRHL